MTLTLHGSAIDLNGCGALIIGPSGSGKSQLTAALVALGARLTADDVVRLAATRGVLIAAPVKNANRRLELRGMGLVRLSADQHSQTTRLRLVVDLSPQPAKRLPEPETVSYLGVSLPLIRAQGASTAAAIKLLLASDGPLPTDMLQ